MHALLHEIEWFSGYENKIKNFVLQVTKLEVEGRVSHRAHRYAKVIKQVLLSLSRPAYIEGRRYKAHAFNHYCGPKGGLRFPLPEGDAVFVPSVDMEGKHEESIDDFLRVALLLESVKAIKKPSVWVRLFPGCVAEPTIETSVNINT